MREERAGPSPGLWGLGRVPPPQKWGHSGQSAGPLRWAFVLGRAPRSAAPVPLESSITPGTLARVLSAVGPAAPEQPGSPLPGPQRPRVPPWRTAGRRLAELCEHRSRLGPARSALGVLALALSQAPNNPPPSANTPEAPPWRWGQRPAGAAAPKPPD